MAEPQVRIRFGRPAVGSEEPRPFIKWVGGKRQLLQKIHQLRPQKFGTYYEPFIGGGALFFELAPKRAVIADSNERLVRTYRGIRNSVEKVIQRLRGLPYEKEFFLKYRAEPIDSGTDDDVAAWFIYLNKTGFNGLYRVNSRNIFNVPFGRYTNPNICDEQTLRACSKVLGNAEILLGDFEVAVAGARKGDFAYFDPPYVPLSRSSNFTSYTAGGFTMDDQERLRDTALALKKRGIHVLLSNSSAVEVFQLYRKSFECVPVDATRSVNSKADQRGAIQELLIR
jgi:DNA adenine methylase